jgi:hypothetical protein
MRWAFLIIAVCAVVALFGVGPAYAVYAAFLVLFLNFATLCLQYDDPVNRARQRVAEQLSHLKPVRTSISGCNLRTRSRALTIAVCATAP